MFNEKKKKSTAKYWNTRLQQNEQKKKKFFSAKSFEWRKRYMQARAKLRFVVVLLIMRRLYSDVALASKR